MDVEILLATCNGAAFLPALLASLEAQTWRHWQLTLRDDGSQDDTPRLIAAFMARHPDQVRCLPPGQGPGGACRNFSTLLSASRAPYVLLADQDDVWLPGKIEALLRVARAEEQQRPGLPVLVHSDLQVVDARLAMVAPSFWQYQSLNPVQDSRFTRLLTENCVTGCATLVNRALLTQANPVPEAAIMHDWWLALVASAFGSLLAVPEPWVQYRQHGHNANGARPWQHGQIARRLYQQGLADARESLARKRKQANAFSTRFAHLPEHPCVQKARQFSQLPSLPWGLRHTQALRMGLSMSTWPRRIGLYCAL